MAAPVLSESNICRLCSNSIEWGNGISLYESVNSEPSLDSIINRYLPLKVSNFLPRILRGSALSRAVDFTDEALEFRTASLLDNEFFFTLIGYPFLLFMIFTNLCYCSSKVVDDGKFPRQICQTCNLKIKDITSYFDVLATGQKRLNELWKEQVIICLQFIHIFS